MQNFTCLVSVFLYLTSSWKLKKIFCTATMFSHILHDITLTKAENFSRICHQTSLHDPKISSNPTSQFSVSHCKTLFDVCLYMSLHVCGCEFVSACVFLYESVCLYVCVSALGSLQTMLPTFWRYMLPPSPGP
jgi:hypothetical protein